MLHNWQKTLFHLDVQLSCIHLLLLYSVSLFKYAVSLVGGLMMLQVSENKVTVLLNECQYLIKLSHV
jgi:hypothetical protein